MAILNNRYLMTALDIEPSTSQATLARLITVLEDDNADLYTVAELIQVEPLLSTAVLKQSNSAYYSYTEHCNNIQEAVASLGSLEILRLVSITVANEMLMKHYSVYSFKAAEFWNISVLTAIILEEIAPRIGIHAWTAYSIGLLHAIGKSVINDYLSTYPKLGHQQSPRVDYISLAQWERSLIGLNHADIAGILMKKWQFPKDFYLPIQYQLNPLDAPEKTAMACILRLALTLAAEISMPKENTELLENTPDAIFEKVSIELDELRGLIPYARARLVDVHKMLFT